MHCQSIIICECFMIKIVNGSRLPYSRVAEGRGQGGVTRGRNQGEAWLGRSLSEIRANQMINNKKGRGQNLFDRFSQRM